MNKLAKILPIAALAVAAPLAITGAAKAQVYVAPTAPAPYACSYYDPYYCPGYAYYDNGWPGYVGWGWGGGVGWGGHGNWGHGGHFAQGAHFAHGGHGGFVGHHR